MPLQERTPPVETVAGLIPPLEDYPYFAGARCCGFEPRAADSAINASWLADASFLVYGDPDFIERAVARSPLPGLGFQLDWVGGRAMNRGFVLENETMRIVVFRGTRLERHNLFDVAELVVINQTDLWSDSQFFPAAFRSGGRVHAGFLAAFAEVSARLDELESGRMPDQALWLTGHSLGGALATLAAAHLGSNAVQGLYTFGCPRVGNAAFVATLPTSGYQRYVYREDVIVTQPPEFLGYVHGGTERGVLGGRDRSFWGELLRGAEGLTTALRTIAQDGQLRFGDLPCPSGKAA